MIVKERPHVDCMCTNEAQKLRAAQLAHLEGRRQLQGEQVAVQGNPSERVVLGDDVPGDALLRQHAIADDGPPRHPVHRELVLLLRPAHSKRPLTS